MGIIIPIVIIQRTKNKKERKGKKNKRTRTETGVVLERITVVAIKKLVITVMYHHADHYHYIHSYTYW